MGAPLDERVVQVVTDFQFAGSGYAGTDARFLALMSATNARNDPGEIRAFHVKLASQFGSGNEA